MIVDSHCHAGESWYEPIETLLSQMDSNGVNKGVLIGHLGAYENNEYLISCKQRFPDRFAVVIIPDLRNQKLVSILPNWIQKGADGIRLKPTMDINDKPSLSIWETASDLGLVVSSIGTIDEFVHEKFISVLSEFPNLKIVLEHLAGAIFNTENNTETSVKKFENIIKLSKYPNVFIKIPGLGELMQKPEILSRKPAFNLNHPLLKMTLDAFGSDRMMWGSDFPPVSFREGYRNSLNEIKDNPLFNQEDSAFIMGKTAYNVFFGKD